MDSIMIVAIVITMMMAVVGVLLAYNDKKIGEWYKQSQKKKTNLPE